MRLVQDATPKHGKAPEWDPSNHWTVSFTIPERGETSNFASKKMQQAALVDLSTAIQTV
jgi:hypothetical protein